MEYQAGYLDGEAWLEAHGPLPLAQGLALGSQVLQALAVAHAAGVVHLDFKPANLLVKKAGGDLSVKVIDFGLARMALAPRRPGGLSQLGTVITGTWDYAAPEQMGATRYGPPGPRREGKGRAKKGKGPFPRGLTGIPAGRSLPRIACGIGMGAGDRPAGFRDGLETRQNLFSGVAINGYVGRYRQFFEVTVGGSKTPTHEALLCKMNIRPS